MSRVCESKVLKWKVPEESVNRSLQTFALEFKMCDALDCRCRKVSPSSPQYPVFHLDGLDWDFTLPLAHIGEAEPDVCSYLSFEKKKKKVFWADAKNLFNVGSKCFFFPRCKSDLHSSLLASLRCFFFICAPRDEKLQWSELIYLCCLWSLLCLLLLMSSVTVGAATLQLHAATCYQKPHRHLM